MNFDKNVETLLSAQTPGSDKKDKEHPKAHQTLYDSGLTVGTSSTVFQYLNKELEIKLEKSKKI